MVEGRNGEGRGFEYVESREKEKGDCFLTASSFLFLQSLIIMYGQRKQIEKVQLLLDEIHSSGMEPNDDLRNELMIVFVSGGERDERERREREIL